MSDMFDIRKATVNTQVPPFYWIEGTYYGKRNVFDIAYDNSENLCDEACQYALDNESKMRLFEGYGEYEIELDQECFLGYNPTEDVFYMGFYSSGTIDYEQELDEFFEDMREATASTLFTAKFDDGNWNILNMEHVLHSGFYNGLFLEVKPKCVIIRAD